MSIRSKTFCILLLIGLIGERLRLSNYYTHFFSSWEKVTKSEYRKNNLNGCFYDMKAQSKHFWNEIYRVRKNAMRLRVAKTLQVYRFLLSYSCGATVRAAAQTGFHLGTQSPSYVVLRANHRFASKLVLWATRSIKQPFRLFYLHLRKSLLRRTPLMSEQKLEVSAKTA